MINLLNSLLGQTLSYEQLLPLIALVYSIALSGVWCLIIIVIRRLLR